MVTARLRMPVGGFADCNPLQPEVAADGVATPTVGRSGNPNEVDGGTFCALDAVAYPFARTTAWVGTQDGSLSGRSPEDVVRAEKAWIGKIDGGIDKLFMSYRDFVRDLGPAPIVQIDNLQGPTFSGILKADPAVIRLSKSSIGDPTQDLTYLEEYWGCLFQIDGFVRIPDRFLELKAEAMQIVKGVATRAVGIDNQDRVAISTRSGAIVANSAWTFADVRNGALASAASLFKAAEAQLSLRGDMGRSWRNSGTVQAIDRAAKSAALDFIREELLAV